MSANTRRAKKRQRTAALQNLSEFRGVRSTRSVLECASPLALSARPAPQRTATWSPDQGACCSASAGPLQEF